MTRGNTLLEEIFDAILLEEAEPTYAALTRWCERYPEHREALSEFFATWAVQAELPQETTVDEERLANLAVSHALNILHRRDEAVKGTTKVSGDRLRLLATARAAGISEGQLADRVELDFTVLEKLDLRRLTGIPRACLERLASALHTIPDRVLRMTAGPPLVGGGTRYKAKKKPVPATEDFVDAIRTSSLSEEAKRFWLELVAVERSEQKG